MKHTSRTEILLWLMVILQWVVILKLKWGVDLFGMAFANACRSFSTNPLCGLLP